MRRLYRGFGLTFASDLPLEGFGPGAGVHDVEIIVGDQAREAIDAADVPAMSMSRIGHDFGFRVPGVCDYLIKGGEEIQLSPAPMAVRAHLALYLAGTAMGMILHRRGIHALHAATIALEGAAIAFVGDQGAGKSTLASALALRGHGVLGDDMIAVHAGESGVAALTGAVEFKLWRETLAHLGLEPGAAIANRMDKFFAPAPGAIVESAPLSAIVVLGPLAGGETAAERVGELAALDLISQHTYRAEYVPLLDRQAAHFTQCAALACRVPVWRLRRPEGLRHLDDTCAWLERSWADLTNAGAMTGPGGP